MEDQQKLTICHLFLIAGEGIDIIIGLGHSGYEKDKEIAHKVPHLDLVIGAHSHSFLYNSEWKLPSSEVPSGQYPTIIKQPGGRSVPVVQAYAFTKYLGSVKLHIDDQGEVTRINGKPILLDSSIEQSESVQLKVQFSRNLHISSFQIRRLWP